MPQQLEYHQIARLLPYGLPWLMLDKVVQWGGNQIVVQKAVSGSEFNMAAHLKDGPSIMPGVLQIEVVNQAVMLLMVLQEGNKQQSDNPAFEGTGVLARVKSTFHSPAYIGEIITATARIVEIVGSKTMYRGELTAGDRKVATVEAIGAVVTESPRH